MDFGWFCLIFAPPWMTPRPLQMHFSATNLLSIWLVQPTWLILMIDRKFSSKIELHASISWNVIFGHFCPPLRRPMRLPMAPHTPAHASLKKYRKHSFIWVQAGLCSSIRSKVIQCSWAIVRAEMAKMATHQPVYEKVIFFKKGSRNDFDEIGSWFLHMDTSQNHWESGSDVTFHLAVPWGAVTIKSLAYKLRNINCAHHLMKHNFQLLLNLGCQSSLKMKILMKSWMCQWTEGWSESQSNIFSYISDWIPEFKDFSVLEFRDSKDFENNRGGWWPVQGDLQLHDFWPF